MPWDEGARLMCVWGVPSLLLVLLLTPLFAPERAAAQLLEGLDTYSDAVVGLATTKWKGPRVSGPVPQPRPTSGEHLDSRDWPLRVHGGTRAQSTLRAAEHAFELLFANGFVTSFGDGAGPRDVYLAERTGAAIDASGNFSTLDGARAFALVDARTPRLEACVAQALMDAQLLELDPAEDPGLRSAVAAYYAWLIGGEWCEDPPASFPSGPWFERLSSRQDRNRGTFLFDMWQFARQRTWEGRDLRASPDLLEAIAKALSLAHESFDLVAGEIAEQLDVPSRVVSFAALPTFPDKRAPPLAVLESTQLRVDLGEPRPGTRLRAWTRTEAGRYVLSALRLDALGHPLSRLEQPPRSDGQLSIELDTRTFAVSVTLTRVADVGLPDPDAPEPERHVAGVIVDAAP
jgi:hypothetical protein